MAAVSQDPCWALKPAMLENMRPRRTVVSIKPLGLIAKLSVQKP